MPAFLLFLTVAAANNSDSPPPDPISTLLPNPGFEDGLTGWVDGYADRDSSEPNQYYSVDIDHSVYYSGTASARVHLYSADHKTLPSVLGHISTKIPADYFRGKRVRLPAYVRTQGEPKKNASMQMSLYMFVPGTIDDKPTDPDIPLSYDGFGGGQWYMFPDWTKQQVVEDIPQEADYLIFGIRAVGYGQAWLDDVQLEVVGQDVRATDKAGVKQLTNLDFEQGWTTWLKGVDFSDYENTQVPTDIGTGPEMAHSGKLGAYIRDGTDTTDSFHYPRIYGQYYRDKELQVSAYMNLDKAPGTDESRGNATLTIAPLYLDQGGSCGNCQQAIYDRGQVLYGTQGWQQIKATVNIPDRTWGYHGLGRVPRHWRSLGRRRATNFPWPRPYSNTPSYARHIATSPSPQFLSVLLRILCACVVHTIKPWCSWCLGGSNNRNLGEPWRSLASWR